MEPYGQTAHMALRRIRRAFVSVSDKKDVVGVANHLLDWNRKIKIISTGGTATALKNAGFTVTDVSDLTGFPEMMDGRVKTLHPKVHGGLLGIRDNPKHVAEMEAHNIEPIDLLVVNFYPFEQTIAKSGISVKEAIENIDIGGPAMVRSAAKNFEDVTVIVDPSQYVALSHELQKYNGSTSAGFRQKRMVEAFELIARYDAAIAKYVAEQYNKGTLSSPT